jgi:hypothetical protein
MTKKSYEELSIKALELKIKNQPTLRDLFAMAALQGVLANPETNLDYGRITYADLAYNHADDMLEARKKKSYLA